MLQTEWEEAADLNLWTDAAGSLGYGAYLQGAWIMGTWSPSQQQHSIQWKELFAIVAAAATWGPTWQRKKIRVHCDNLAIVQVWQAKNPRDKQLAALCRTLFFIAAQNHFNMSIHHLPGTSNPIADALSRQQVQRFRSLAPSAATRPTPTPAWLTEL